MNDTPQKKLWHLLNQYYYEDLDRLYKSWENGASLKLEGDPISSPMSLGQGKTHDFIFLLNTISYLPNIPQFLKELRTLANASTRILVTFHNPGWEIILQIATFLGLRQPRSIVNWLNYDDIHNLLSIGGYEIIYHKKRFLFPLWLPFFSWFCNAILARLPIFNSLCLTEYVIARLTPIKYADCSCSVIIPARNEAENIEDCLARLPQLGERTEVVFIEGHSQDNTWEVILQMQQKYADRYLIQCYRQEGIGKGDAVRMGFAKATGEILIILDSDLTVPPEDIVTFYEVIAAGCCELANGCRLIYPIQQNAMPWLNQMANHLFAKILSQLLNIRIKDSLCGTKAISRENYLRITQNKSYLGSTDPFGDFELLFGAAYLGLKIQDIPVHYFPRTYGKSNIHHVRDGFKLLEICRQFFFKNLHSYF